MLTKIRRLGNSRGILIPKPLLRQAGLEDSAEILVEGNTLVVRQPKRAPRDGWAEASKQACQLAEMTGWCCRSWRTRRTKTSDGKRKACATR